MVLAKDEEERIGKCLSHLRPYVDYIIVIDGESIDKTVEKAKKIADYVEVKPFSGSFAEERNYAQDLAPSEWCLHVDVDEVFPEDFLRNMKQIITYRNADAFRFPRNNLPRNNDPTFPDYQTRLLNKNKMQWEDTLHEAPTFKCLGRPNIITLDEYVITHLSRLVKRPWH